MMNKTLLVAESAEFLDTMALALKQEPFFVTGVRTADEARVVLVREPIGVVVVDESIHDARGADFLIELCHEHPAIPRIHLASRLDLDGALRLINQAQIHRVLCKPCSADELSIAIRSLLRRHTISTLNDRIVHLARRQAGLVEEINRESAAAGERAPGTSINTQELVAPARTAGHGIMHAHEGGGGSFGGAMAASGFGGAFSTGLGFAEGDPIANLPALEAHSLSRREKEILRAMAAGQKPRDMARLFFISVHTARNHIKSIYRKLGVHAQGELMAKVLNAPGRERFHSAG